MIRIPKANRRGYKTYRILKTYHMLRHFEEVSMQELRNTFSGTSDKTFSRDIAFLKRAGVPIRFSGRRKAFVLHGNFCEPTFPEGAKERQLMEKILRLMTIMDEVPEADCDVWYRENFPELSKRTMQRDFTVINELCLGYKIYYKREWLDPDYKDDAQPPGHYYLRWD